MPLIELTQHFESDEINFAHMGKFTLFLFDGTNTDELFCVISELDLKANPLTVVQVLILLAKRRKFVLLTELSQLLAEKHKIPVPSVRRHIQTLVARKILVRKDISLNNKVLARGVGYEFNSPHNIELELMNTKKEKSQTISGRSAAVRESVNEALVSQGLSKKDIAYRDYLGDGFLIPSNIVMSEYFALASKKRNQNNYNQKEFNIGNFDYIVEAKAHTQTNTQPALQQFFSLMNLAISYNAKMISKGYYQEPFQNRMFPAHIGDILHVRGHKDSGQARARVHRQIIELRETIYNWTTLQAVNVPDHLESMFKQEDFQFIVSIKTNSTVAPRVVKGKEVEHIPIIYFIQFHDDVIDALKKADWFFSVPWQVAQGSPLIFTFYLALRSLKVTIDSILVDDIKKRIAFDGSAKRFVADLREELEVFYRNTSKNNTNFEFNLCGYFIRFSSNENGELTIFVKCDEKEMITTAGAKYAGKHSAPTLPNPIRRSRIEALSVKALDHKTDVERTLNYLNTRIVAPETKRYLKYRVLSFGGLQHVISAYSTDSEIKWLAQELQQFIETSLTVTIDTLNELKGQLSKLRFGSYEISDELFMEYYNYLGNVGLCSDIGAFFEIVKSYRSKKYRLWVERRFHEMSET